MKDTSVCFQKCSSKKMLLLTERNQLCKDLFIINLQLGSRDLVPKCCIGGAPKESGKCCGVAFQRDKEGRFVKSQPGNSYGQPH